MIPTGIDVPFLRSCVDVPDGGTEPIFHLRSDGCVDIKEKPQVEWIWTCVSSTVLYRDSLSPTKSHVTVSIGGLLRSFSSSTVILSP